MQDALWLQACGSAAAAARPAWCAALRARGLPADLGPPRPDAAPGLLLFDAFDEDLRDQLSDLTRGRAARVLALHVGEALPDAATHWALLAAGAAELLDGRDPAAQVPAVAARLDRWRAVDAIVASPLVRDNLVGSSPAWLRVLRQLVEIACFSQGGVLIGGESGTGKEMAARLIHTLDARRAGGRLVVLDCTTVMPELAGSEFFGHERGAFTGAAAARDGAFALADGGTLFLDEVGELPPAMQAQLLRVIQERCYKRVGGSGWQRSEFRLVCATHRELQAEVDRGAFRHDLYWRVAGHALHLPPLRERPQDIVPLAERFLAEALGRAQAPPLHEAVRAWLLARPYGGNVRELRQLAARIAGRYVGEGPIGVGCVPEDERPAAPVHAPDWRGADFDAAVRRALGLGVGLREISAHAAEVAIRIAVGEEDGNLQRAARRLGVTDRALQLRRAGKGG